MRSLKYSLYSSIIICSIIISCKYSNSPNSIFSNSKTYSTYYEWKMPARTFQMKEHFIIVIMNNGNTEVYDTSNMMEKQKFISKYGNIPNLNEIKRNLQTQIDSANILIQKKIIKLQLQFDSINKRQVAGY